MIRLYNPVEIPRVIQLKGMILITHMKTARGPIAEISDVFAGNDIDDILAAIVALPQVLARTLSIGIATILTITIEHMVEACHQVMIKPLTSLIYILVI